MKNSRYKQLLSYRLCVVLCSVMKSHAVSLLTARDVTHPLVQRLHAVYAPAISYLVVALSVVTSATGVSPCWCSSHP